jgi:cytidine deaminase
MEALVEAAKQARAHAYAPYSRYRVGAAVRADNGKTYVGVNVENASYGLALCAERSAVAAAITDGARALEAVAVVTSTSPPAAPCGMCRQTLAEFAHDLPVVLVNDDGERVQTTLAELLPRAFRREDLK